MNKETMFDAVTDIRDDLVEQAAGHSFRKKSVRRWSAAIAAVLALVLVAGVLMTPGTPAVITAEALTAPAYPELPQRPLEQDYTDSEGNLDYRSYMDDLMQWQQDSWNGRPAAGFADSLHPFFTDSIRATLGGAASENRICSPVNLYLALGMLTEVTDGASRQQILDALQTPSVDALREQAGHVWQAAYRDDGVSASVLAGSLWLSDSVAYEQQTLQALADHYYAASFRGTMGSEEYNALLQRWLNDQTGGLLSEQASGVTLTPQTLLALATTVRYQARWTDEFNPANTADGTFHGAAGDETAAFLHRDAPASYYWGEHFAAVSEQLDDGSTMWFLLPDEDVSAQELIADDEAMAFLLTGSRWEQQNYLTVHRSIPKFDIASQLDLTESLQALGIRDVFDFETADFSPLTEEKNELALTQAEHSVRVAIDEEGVTAAAYTVMQMAGAGAPPADEVTFTLDRPFVFAITGTENLPLFVGVVNQIG